MKECKRCGFTNIAENKFVFLCLKCGLLTTKNKQEKLV